jgi:TetR/AcrR family transcriptional repressor of nem operon
MGHSRAEKAQSRERILDAAALKIRGSGLDGVSIGELMKSVNLTHGGFYGHFPSREALIAAALERAMDHSEAALAATPTDEPPGTVGSLIDRYLSPQHRDSIAVGCTVAALAADVSRHEDPSVRRLMAERCERASASLANAMGGGPAAQDAAVTAWCTMIGALLVSRVFRDTPFADDILEHGRRAVLDLAAQVARPDGTGPRHGS